jgi:polyhydroxyalkanoate synthesis regulator phasin
MSVSLEEARTRLDADLAQCTQRFGFEPAARDNPERALAQGEREWRACAYDGVRKHLIPNSSLADVYNQLIGEDRRLTDRLDRGEITRAERRQRLDELIARIRETELAQRRKEEEQRLSEFMDQQMEDVLRARHRLDPF